MSELPKSVRNRLAASTVDAHPDADLLTGFVERRLGEAERRQVIAHLAKCTDCREVVALALPPMEAAAAAPAAARRSWFAPVLLFRWGTLVAAVIVVAAALWLRRPEPQRPTSDGQAARAVAPPDSAAAPPPSWKAAPAPARQTEANRDVPPATQNARPEQSPALRMAAPAPSADRAAIAVEHSPVVAARPDSDQLGAVATPPPNGGANLGYSAAARRTLAMAPAAPPPPETARPDAEAAAVRAYEAKKAPAAAMARREAAAGRESATKALPAAVSVRYFWRISGDGQLQRSLDRQQWQSSGVGEGARFHSLAGIGPELWAGGTGGALYHSSDNGINWQLVNVPGLGAETVLRLEFRTALDGRLVTASSTWTTPDGGRSWVKQ